MTDIIEALNFVVPILLLVFGIILIVMPKFPVPKPWNIIIGLIIIVLSAVMIGDAAGITDIIPSFPWVDTPATTP